MVWAVKPWRVALAFEASFPGWVFGPPRLPFNEFAWRCFSDMGSILRAFARLHASMLVYGFLGWVRLFGLVCSG